MAFHINCQTEELASLSTASCWSSAGCSAHVSSWGPWERPSLLVLLDWAKLAQPVCGGAGSISVPNLWLSAHGCAQGALCCDRQRGQGPEPQPRSPLWAAGAGQWGRGGQVPSLGRTIPTSAPPHMAQTQWDRAGSGLRRTACGPEQQEVF